MDCRQGGPRWQTLLTVGAIFMMIVIAGVWVLVAFGLGAFGPEVLGLIR